MGNTSNNSGYGFRVLKTQIHSPAYEAGLQPFLDFIVNIELNHSELKEANIPSIHAFFNTIKSNENKEIHVTVFNIYNRQLRKIKLLPNKSWPEADSLLGALLRYEEYITALERTYKIIQVIKPSLAQSLGLIEEYDYILGITNLQYKDLNEFIRCLFKADDICVFNVKENKIKFINMPKEKCQLGCQFGEGILNQLPYKRYDMPLMEQVVKNEVLHEEIVNLTENDTEQTNTTCSISQVSPKKNVIIAPPKKNEILKENEQKSGIGLDDNHQAKNYQDLLKQSSKYTVDYIQHKRAEHMKKNGSNPNTRLPPKNPFQSPTLLANKEENHEKNEKVEVVELYEKNDKNETSDVKHDQIDRKNEKKEKNDNVQNIKNPEDINEHQNNSESLKSKEETKEILETVEIQRNEKKFNGEEKKEKEDTSKNPADSGKFAKMMMKYSYYCPRIKNEYVINSCDLMSMNVVIE